MSHQGFSKILSLFVLLLGTAVLVLSSDAAFAAAPFAAGGNTMKNDIIGLITPVIGIGIVALGLMCAFGKINWGWFVAAVIGIIIVYGNEQIISWVRSAFGI